MITLPELFCPFEPAVNPNKKSAVDHTNQWVQKYSLHPGATYEKYLSDNFGAMTARFYPSASLNNLLLANDINTLLFVWDDAMDHTLDDAELIHSRDAFVQFSNKCINIMENPFSVQHELENSLVAFVDVWKRLMGISSKEWIMNFRVSISKMLNAGLWEFDNCKGDKLPSFAQFYEKRQFLGAAHISTDLITVIEDIQLPSRILEHPVVARLTYLARNCVCWANDLFSLSKEIEHGDQHNMVLILMNERGIKLEDAIIETVVLHDKEMGEFVNLSSKLPDFGDHDEAIKKYVAVLASILKGNIDWSSSETARYQFSYEGNN